MELADLSLYPRRPGGMMERADLSLYVLRCGGMAQLADLLLCGVREKRPELLPGRLFY